MSEFIRKIDEAEFVEGLSRRMSIGEVAVGNVCKIRFESVTFDTENSQRGYLEAAVTIVELIDLSQLPRRTTP